MFKKALTLSARALSIAALIALAGCAGTQFMTGGAEATGGYRGGEVIAILLPQTGRYAGAARAVRDGVLAARDAAAPGAQPQIVFYDSSDPASAPSLLQQAAANGASLVIGPLQKEAVTALVASGPLPVPTLALNRAATEAAPPANLFQFALAPEDEAANVARKAWAEGHRSALILYPDGRWGDRMAFGFRQEWLALGGQVAASAIYTPGAADFSVPVTDLFARAGGAPGADFLFMVATATTARKLWPQVQASGGAGLNVFSTSHVSGPGTGPDAGAPGLSGLYLVDIPWLLTPEPADPLSRERLQGKIAGIDQRYIRLYAMGIDAYGLAPRLSSMTRNPGSYMDGRTGRLSLDDKRRVRRELVLARYQGPRPVPVAMLPAGTTTHGRAAPANGDAFPLIAAAGTGAVVPARP
jgi:outer membrane PBP1 activator LpoA protein